MVQDFLSGALVAFVFSGAEPFMQFDREHYEEHSCENIFNLGQWFRRCRLKKNYTRDGQTREDGERRITIAKLPSKPHILSLLLNSFNKFDKT